MNNVSAIAANKRVHLVASVLVLLAQPVTGRHLSVLSMITHTQTQLLTALFPVPPG